MEYLDITEKNKENMIKKASIRFNDEADRKLFTESIIRGLNIKII